MVEQTENLVKKYQRKECEDLLKRKFFFTPSFEIYGGVAGLYDYGPLGSMLKNNVEQLWRQHFILEEDMLEVSCSNLTPEDVLKTSGHVEKFADFMVKDMKTHLCHRVDKLIEEFVEKTLAKKKDLKPEEREKLIKVGNDAGSMKQEQLNAVIKEYGIKAPDTNNDLSEALPFNLMFETQIGPTGHLKGYMRPETAQGIFVNFRRLLDYNNGKMPFAAAQIGIGFRNEIHPKQGLLRVREFTMAEIEHFVDENNKDHPKFDQTSNILLSLLTKQNQEGSREIIRDLPLDKAVESGVINNQTLAYFMARTHLFLKSVGIPDQAIRFRQHRDDEMAHYSKDCWDAEIETSYGWIEVAGHADRSCFDLTKHAERTRTELKAAKMLPAPKEIKVIKIIQNKQVIGKTFKGDAKAINEFFEYVEDEKKESLMKEMEDNSQIVVSIAGKEITLNKDIIQFECSKKMVQEEKYTPAVIEPSFGIGRIVYCIFEHCFRIRPDNATRTFFQFPPLIAPLKASILPLLDNKEMNTKVREIKSLLTKAGVTSKIDDSGTSIGRRYARTDECGIPFAITVDFDTLADDTVTLRDLNTLKQVRMKIQDVANTIVNLALGSKEWNEVLQQYPAFEPKESDKDAKD